MQRVTRSTAVASPPAAPGSPGPPGYFTGGNPAAGTPATVPGYEWFNQVQEELVAAVVRSGLALDPADTAQLRKSLDRLFGGALRTVSADTALTADDAGLVLVNASGGNRVITLPAANAAGGRPIRLHLVRTDTSANAATVSRAGTDTIEGETALALEPGSRVLLLSDGVAAWRAWADAVLAWHGATQLFTASGTFTAVKTGWHIAHVWGGGGGGSGGTGASGGGGGYARKRVFLAKGSQVTVTVGSGGAGASDAAQAGNGGSSSFGAFCSATGGGGAAGGPGSAGTGSGGDVNAAGQVGIDLVATNERQRGGLPPVWIGRGAGGDASTQTPLGGSGVGGAVLVEW